MKLKLSFNPLLLSLLLPFNAPAVLAADASPLPRLEEGSEGVNYVGGSPRFGIGRDTRYGVTGEAQVVVDEDAGSAKIVEGWISSNHGNNAGGLKLNYHWVPNASRESKLAASVRKVFLAVDQNREKDKKLTFGGGMENTRYFLSGGVSRSLTGDRLVAEDFQSATILLLGAENGLDYSQQQTTTQRTRFLERAYDWGVGFRAGRFYDAQQIRLTGGLDHEWGKGSARQSTLSLAAEKFFEGTPHSVGLALEASRKSGSLESDRDDLRATLMYRYEFGGKNYRPVRNFRMVQVAVPAGTAASAGVVEPSPPAPERKEQRLVKTTASMSSGAFFGFNSASLTPVARDELDKVVGTLKQNKIEGRIHITGHTCDIGTAGANLKISALRAKAVADYLIKNGGLSAAQILQEGKGKAQPRFPNTPATRHKNRRVELEFVTVGEKIEEVVIPGTPAPGVATPVAPPQAKVEWRKEYLSEEPGWMRRALHNPAGHKRTVDFYRRAEVEVSQSLGVRRYNRFPVAGNDSFVVGAYQPSVLNVLDNDSDPDGDALSIVSVTPSQFGSLNINAGKTLTFTPYSSFLVDNFNYTISDNKGGTVSASVHLIDP